MKRTDIPADVPKEMEDIFIQNYAAITKNTENLFLFVGDHKIEHLNKDFYGESIAPEVNDPEHLFKIASQGDIGAFSTQLGLIARYIKKYPDINYIAKLNAKTDIIPKDAKDPLSKRIWKVDHVVAFREKYGHNIAGVGYTVYIGSEYENKMLKKAAEIVTEAHKNGLVAILWMYPRGKHVKNEYDPDIIAGAAGVAACLGADFAKINPPRDASGKQNPELLQQAVQAAGNTKLICSGGPKMPKEEFLKNIKDQMNIGGTHGIAAGRNIFQQPLAQAIELTKTVSELVYKK